MEPLHLPPLEALPLNDLRRQATSELRALASGIDPEQIKEHTHRTIEEQVQNNIDLVKHATSVSPAVKEFLSRGEVIRLAKAFDDIFDPDELIYTANGFKVGSSGMSHIYRWRDETPNDLIDDVRTDYALVKKFARLNSRDLLKKMANSTKPGLISKLRSSK